MVFNAIFNSISVMSQGPVHLSSFPGVLLTHSHNWHLLMPLGNKPFENTMGKGEIACNEQFLLFPQCFLPIWITFCHFHQIWNCRLQTLSVCRSLKFVVWSWVKHYSIQYSFQTIGCFPTDEKVKVASKFKFVEGKKYCWNSRKCWFPAFFLFPTMFSK